MLSKAIVSKQQGNHSDFQKSLSFSQSHDVNRKRFMHQEAFQIEVINPALVENGKSGDHHPLRHKQMSLSVFTTAVHQAGSGQINNSLP